MKPLLSLFTNYCIKRNHSHPNCFTKSLGAGGNMWFLTIPQDIQKCQHKSFSQNFVNTPKERTRVLIGRRDVSKFDFYWFLQDWQKMVWSDRSQQTNSFIFKILLWMWIFSSFLLNYAVSRQLVQQVLLANLAFPTNSNPWISGL